MRSESVTIKNIKISIVLQTSERVKKAILNLANSGEIGKKTSSFFIFRSTYIYTIFFIGHINCTGIKTLSNIPTALDLILSHLQLGSECVTRQNIDSILAVGRISNYICMPSFANFLKKKKYNVQYNPQRFPGICIKKLPGCALTFLSGKVVYTGLK